MAGVSRHAIIQWLSDINCPIEKIEDVGKGTVLCQLLKKLDPSFPKFKENPKNSNEYQYNLKLVQIYFEKKKTKLFFPIERMVLLKMQDNLEVIQWFYNYYERESVNLDRTEDVKEDKVVLKEDKVVSKEDKIVANEKVISKNDKTAKNNDNIVAKETTRKEELDEKASAATLNFEKLTVTSDLEKEKKQILDLKTQVEKLKEFAKVFQTERDFYFSKLVKIEKLLKDKDFKMSESSSNEILNIMYEN